MRFLRLLINWILLLLAPLWVPVLIWIQAIDGLFQKSPHFTGLLKKGEKWLWE